MGEDVLLVVQVGRTGQKNASLWHRIIFLLELCQEADFAEGAEEADHNFADLILLQADRLGLPRLPA